MLVIASVHLTRSVSVLGLSLQEHSNPSVAALISVSMRAWYVYHLHVHLFFFVASVLKYKLRAVEVNQRAVITPESVTD